MLAELFENVAAQFLNEFYLKLPFAMRETAAQMSHVGSWPTLQTIVKDRDVDMLAVRQGQRWDGQDDLTFDFAMDLFRQGYTLVVRHAERHEPQVARLADDFTKKFQGAVDVQMYFTPQNSYGFSWHYDAEEVFFLQTQGEKVYQFRKNTVQPWPLIETLPADMQYDREIMPLMTCTLSAGDWLYLPAGYWHRAEARSDSISLAVGVQSTAAIELLDFIRPQLVSSLIWRQRLPPIETAGDNDAMACYRSVSAALANELVEVLNSSDTLSKFLAARRAHLSRAKH